MGKAVETLRSGLKVGHVALGAHGDVPGSVRQQTHDGDTVIVDPDGNLGVRFLGVDAPEVSFTLPGSSTTFVSIADPRWEAFLADPFDQSYGPFTPPLVLVGCDHRERRSGGRVVQCAVARCVRVVSSVPRCR